MPKRRRPGHRTHLHMAGVQISDGLARALVGHVRHRGAGHLLEQRAAQVVGRADAGRTVEHLARIEQVLRIERRLDPPHEVDRDRPMLLFHIFPLLLADAMLAGAGAAHVDGAMGEAVCERIRGFDLHESPEQGARAANPI